MVGIIYMYVSTCLLISGPSVEEENPKSCQQVNIEEIHVCFEIAG